MFSFLWKSKKRNDITKSAKDVGLSVDHLNESSTRLSAPGFVKFDLWRHQEAMLKRCVDIETKITKKVSMIPTNALRYEEKMRPQAIQMNVGIMNDPPGCGKTAVALALMARDTGSLNMVIVPSHIHKQWVEAVDKFLPPNQFKYVTVTDYKDTQDLGIKLRHVNLVITTTFFADLVSSVLANQDPKKEVVTKIKRVFVDEIDTVGPKALANIPVCECVWFMSASFNPLADKKIGPFDLSDLTENEILQRVCKCDIKFMIDCQPKLEDPAVRVITIPDGGIEIFKGLTDDQGITLMNALNLQRAKKRVLERLFEEKVKTPRDLAAAKIKEVEKDIEQLEQEIDDTIKHKYLNDDEKERAISVLSPKIDDKKAYLTKLKANVELYDSKQDDTATMRTKLDELDAICKNLALESQWVFFSDDDYIFDLCRTILDNHKIKYTSLDQGTQEKNDIELRRYKNGEVQVLFINSIQEGVGINLENTSDVLFLHYTNEKMIDQLVCRAQRPGRKCQLKIWCLYHENEKP